MFPSDVFSPLIFLHKYQTRLGLCSILYRGLVAHDVVTYRFNCYNVIVHGWVKAAVIVLRDAIQISESILDRHALEIKQ